MVIERTVIADDSSGVISVLLRSRKGAEVPLLFIYAALFVRADGAQVLIFAAFDGKILVPRSVATHQNFDAPGSESQTALTLLFSPHERRA